MPDIPLWQQYSNLFNSPYGYRSPYEELNYPKLKPIKIRKPNRFDNYKIGDKRYDASLYKDKMFELYLNEVDPYEYGDYDDLYADFDPFAYRQLLMQKELDRNYNLTNINIINSAIPNGVGSILPSDAKPPLKLPRVTRKAAENDAVKNSSVEEIDENSFSGKFANSTFGKHYDAWAAAADGVANIGAMFSRGQKTYNGPKGHIRAGIDQGWNTIADTAAQFGPAGLMASLGMKGINALNNISGAIFGSTDGMTTTDSVFDSPIGMLTGLGWINQAFGQKTDTIRKNNEIFALLGTGYSGTNASVDHALEFSGKKYGTFSSPARKDANALIAEMKHDQTQAEYAANTALQRYDLATGMSAIAGNGRAFDMQGGYNQAAIHQGRNGMKLAMTAKRVVSKYKYQNGGIVKPLAENNQKTISFIKELTLDLLPEQFKEGGSLEKKEETPKDYTLIIDYAKSKNFNWINRWLDPNRKTIPDWEVEGQVATHKLSYGLKNIDGKEMFVVYPEVLEIDGLLFDFTDPKNEKTWKDALDNAFNNKELLLFDNEKSAKWFTEHYKEYAPAFDKYEKGGKFNVIPDGALHARLHHMENADNLTKKGIPVVSEGKNGELEQQAEIERDEIILRISVTEKLEKLMKKYNSDEYTQKEKDEFAIEAGKLLVEELLYNTLDNTGLINNIN